MRPNLDIDISNRLAAFVYVVEADEIFSGKEVGSIERPKAHGGPHKMKMLALADCTTRCCGSGVR